MKKTRTLEEGCYYVFESKSTARTCFFESEEEIRIFRKLVVNYLGRYVKVDKLFIYPEGYQIMVQLCQHQNIVNHYIESRQKKNKMINPDYVLKPWLIVSEQMRILLSRFAKLVNKMRSREGALVQKRYEKYYFVTVESYKAYLAEKKKEKILHGQKNERYRVSKRWKRRVDWGRYFKRYFEGSVLNKGFQDHVVRKLLKFTILAHTPPPPT